MRGYAAIILIGALIIIGYFAYQGAQMLIDDLECADLRRLDSSGLREQPTLQMNAELPADNSDSLARHRRGDGACLQLHPGRTRIASPMDCARLHDGGVHRLAAFAEGGGGTLGGFQFEENVFVDRSIGARYHVGVDGISLWLVLLTTLLMPIAILSSWTAVTKRQPTYYVFLLLLESAMIGVFVSLDLLLFYLFFEASLVPMFFLIGIWGGERRIYAAVKFFIYTAVGSC